MEVILSALPPNFLVNSPQPATGIGQGGGQVPSVLAALPPGTLISGFVINRDDKGKPILRTASGDFVLDTAFFLKIGSDVVVRVNATGPNFRASIVTVDGLPPEQAEAVAAHATDADVVAESEELPHRQAPAAASARSPDTSQTAAASPTAAAPARPAVISGTLIAPADDAPAEFATPQPGSTVAFRVVNVTYPPQTTLPDLPLDAEEFAKAPPPAYAAYNRAAPASSAPALSVPLAAIPLPDGARGVQALVTAITSGGQTVIQTPLGTVQLSGHHALPVGSQLVLAPQAPLTASVPVTPAATPAELATAWPALQELITTLQQQAPDAALQLLKSLMPPHAPNPLAAPPQSAGFQPAALAPQLGNSLLFFLSALKGGDLGQFLGRRVTETLEQLGHASLLHKAGAEFANLRELYFNAAPGQWQALFVPLLAEEELRFIRMFVKRDREKKSDKERAGGSDTRFVVEMEMSLLGPFQLDGFVKKREDGTRFHLIIRSHTELSEETRREIFAIYNAAGEVTGFTGVLMFQHTPEFPVRPLEEIMGERHRDVTA